MPSGVDATTGETHGHAVRPDRTVTLALPETVYERLLVDAAAMDLIRRPQEFDVVVASNLFGDIITDIGAQVTGSMGLAPSGNVHAGDSNPLATVLSWSMLFDDLGEMAAADALWSAVTDQLADESAPRTPDIGGEAGTGDVVADLRSRL
ncbi:MAG: isocitrate/isopropylmalate family dehydrogenase [Halobacteriales archaeon]